MMMLQNKPGDWYFPNSPGAEIQQRKLLSAGMSWPARCALLCAALLLVAGAFFMLLDAPNKALANKIGLLLLGLGILFLVGFAVSLYRRASESLQDQRRYLTKGRLPQTTPSQRLALRLDAHNAYHHTGWSETLEYWPVARRLRDADCSPWRSKHFVIEEAKIFLDSLDEWWGVSTAQGCSEMIDRLFKGMHSQHFLRLASDDDAQALEANVVQLAALIGESPEYVHSCFESKDGRPPQLLWGFDLWRVLPIARDAYMANLIDEQRAWQWITQAADWCHEIFPSLAAYHLNLRLGHAFWSGDFDAVAERRSMIEAFTQATPGPARWPMADLPWSARPTTLTLPTHVMRPV